MEFFSCHLQLRHQNSRRNRVFQRRPRRQQLNLIALEFLTLFRL